MGSRLFKLPHPTLSASGGRALRRINQILTNNTKVSPPVGGGDLEGA